MTEWKPFWQPKSAVSARCAKVAEVDPSFACWLLRVCR